MFVTHAHYSRATSVFYITKKGVVKRLKSAKTPRLMGALCSWWIWMSIKKISCLCDLHLYVSTQKTNNLNQVFVLMKTTTDMMYDRTSYVC